ncbi:MAG: flagellar hook-basal body complex protein, partial [Nakamurella sp.]
TAGVWGPGPQPNANATPPTKPAALDLSALLNGYKAVTVAGPPVATTYTPVTNADLPIPTAPVAGTTYGKYVSYTIDSAGTVNAVRDDGGVQPIGQLTMATFSNPNGLTKVGDSEYNTTASSGAPIYGGANDGTHGSISAGYLEMSNVDLAAELTNLIIAQRGFQANSKTITTSDQILQTLVSMKQ